MSNRFITWTLAACLFAASVAAQDETTVNESDAEIIDRILVLQRQLDELMALLSPEVREEVRQRLAEPDAEVEPVAEVETAGEVESSPEAETVGPTPATAPPPETTPLPETAAPEVAAVPEVTPVPEATAAPEVTAAASTAPPPLPRRIRRRKECNTLAPLDENADGKINAADRHWRHLYLWTDRNGDRQMQDKEVESAYDRGVREVAVSLETFLRTKGNLGEVRVEDQVVLDLRGDGFSERSRRDDGVLVVDATAIQRGQGLKLLGPDGETLDGFQAFRSGLRIKQPEGTVTQLDCP